MRRHAGAAQSHAAPRGAAARCRAPHPSTRRPARPPHPPHPPLRPRTPRCPHPSAARFKARKNSEPKIGPDGQPRLNARQRRTLRRARERALKGLLEISQALLQKADINVQVPNLKDLAALEELAEAEAERAEAAAAAAEAGSPAAAGASLGPRLSGGSSGSDGGSSGADALGGGGGADQDRASGAASAAAALAEAAAVAGESVEKIALAAVAAVAAAAAGKDTTRAAAAAQAAAAQAASAAAVGRSAAGAGGLSIDLDGLALRDQDDSAASTPAGTPTPDSLPCLASRPLLRSPGPAAAAAASGARPSGARAAPLARAGSGGLELDGSLDIGTLINQLSSKKDEGMVDDKLIRDLQIIQNLIGALKAPTCSPSPAAAPAAPASSGGAPARGVRRAFSYTPGVAAGLQQSYSVPH
jgi:hypothetical protein